MVGVTISTIKRREYTVVQPSFNLRVDSDIMTRGGAFYAYWDESIGLWSTDLFSFYEKVDSLTRDKANELGSYGIVSPRYFYDSNSGLLGEFKNWIKNAPDNYIQLDTDVTFLDEHPTKEMHRSKRLPYSIVDSPCPAYNELISTLYSPEQSVKFEWAVGSILTGNGKNIQKFLVFYGNAGSGKSTVLNIISMLLDGYCAPFEAKALVGSNNTFGMEPFRENPLVAIQHDGDLSKIEDNSKINSIVSHEVMIMNEKHKSVYSVRLNAFLFMGSNKPVKITDGKSGILRRLIDVTPTGNTLPYERYLELLNKIPFELGAIANKCIKIYQSLGENYYGNYIPRDMSMKTDVFYNFVEANYFELKEDGGISLKRAYALYKAYCEETLVEFKMPMYRFREELKNYYSDFKPYIIEDGKIIRSYFSEFKADLFESAKLKNKSDHDPESSKALPDFLQMVYTVSILDTELSSCKAQYSTEKGTPQKKWRDVETTLADIDTSKLHYVKPKVGSFIVIDFDLKDENGNKSKELNLKAAASWPPTYAEFSQGGNGIHLHYIYTGNFRDLSTIYSEGIEIKTFNGGASLRRKVIYCNNLPVATFPGVLPKKERRSVINFEGVKNERALRTLINKNLAKEYHPATKPSIDFIFNALEDAYKNGVKYDVTDLRPKIMAFAANSTHQSENCLKLVSKMHFSSDEPSDNVEEPAESEIIFFDVEVFPNLFLVNWKFQGPEHPMQRMINPTSQEIETLLTMGKLVGFNNRRYDNHILYARYIGYDNQELYQLSKRLIRGSANATFGEAYKLSYTDIYDFSSAGHKQSLKKWEIELGLHHQELGFDWDEPVPEEKWIEVSEYCDNDVISTEATFNHLKGDWKARQILAKLSGLTVNDTTNAHTTRIIFGTNKHPDLVYTDLSETFPGYSYENGKNMYRGEDVGKGGLVWAVPGMYGRTLTFDVRSQHPSSIIAMNCFGEHTARFEELVNARAVLKHAGAKNAPDELLQQARNVLNGELRDLILTKEDAEDVSDALKTAINSVYGLTMASFDTPFRDKRNVNNIVALRGALFMATLRDEVIARGGKPIHIKTDSIKIVNPSEEIISFVMEFGKKYGYDFEIEHIFEKICLTNNAVYIAKLADDDPKSPGKWTATGAQFAHSYVFKTLFSGEKLEAQDYYETKSVTSPASIYLDMNEGLGDDEHNYIFVGRVGLFCPVREGTGGGYLTRIAPGEKPSFIAGTKGYRWREAEVVEELGLQDDIDDSYQKSLVDEALSSIGRFGDVEAFRDCSPEETPSEMCLVENNYPNCNNCDKFDVCQYYYKIPF